jgi:hypothetical protein
MNKKNINEQPQDFEFGEALIARSKILSQYLQKIEPSYQDGENVDCNFSFESIREMLTCFRWSYPIISNVAPTVDVDRLSPMLIGPLFTSDKHPWPRNARRYLEPLIQFDLEWAGQLGNVNLGKGILQLWLTPFGSEFNHHEIRVIPKEDFLLELLSPIPEVITRHYFGDNSYFAGEEYSWLDKENEGDAVVMAQIGKPEMTWHRSLRGALEDLAYHMGDENAAPINDFLEFLPAKSPSPTPHFFGICDPIQYDAAEAPPCLLALESEGPYIWGDSGNAQLFYVPQKDGTTLFDFAWSCH